MNLHLWQEQAVSNTLASVASGKNPVLVAPTGGGKTVMGAAIVARTTGRVLWVAHRRELINQAIEHLERTTGEVCGVIMAGVPANPIARIQVASIQTLNARQIDNAPDLIVIDEAHHVVAESYRELLGAQHMGLTATPFRLDGKGLGRAFDEIVVACRPSQLIATGQLVKPRVYAPTVPNLAKVKMLGGDYSESALDHVMNTTALHGRVVDHWQRLAPGSRTVAFCVTVDHARNIADRFTSVGVRAGIIHGGLSVAARDQVLCALRDGEITVLTNCMVLTEGWDFPSLQTALLLRPTASTCLHLQMIGRVMRSCVNKAGAVVIDHAGNHLRHGAADDDREFTLDDEEVVQSTAAKHKTCPECFAVIPVSASICPECGHSFAPTDHDEPNEYEENDDKLVEYTGDEEFIARAAKWNRLSAEAIRRGFKIGWAYHQFFDAFGFWPVVNEGRLVNPRRATMSIKRAYYNRLMGEAKVRAYKIGWASWKYKEAFGVWPRFFKEQES